MSATQVPSTGLTMGVLAGQLNHQLTFLEHVTHGAVQAPLSGVLTHFPSVGVVFLAHSVTQYPFWKLNPVLHDNQLLSLFPEHSAQL